MSGKKFDQKKPPISLIPREAIEAEAQALAFGANKYGRYNFREGIEYSRLIDAALRHILAIADGEDLDEESQCFHAGNARANLGMLLYMMKHKPEKDDRYKPKVPEQNEGHGIAYTSDPDPRLEKIFKQTYHNPLPSLFKCIDADKQDCVAVGCECQY